MRWRRLAVAHSRVCSLLSFAATAKQYDYVRPELDLSPHLMIRDGRHPLQEFCVDQFVRAAHHALLISALLISVSGAERHAAHRRAWHWIDRRASG